MGIESSKTAKKRKPAVKTTKQRKPAVKTTKKRKPAIKTMSQVNCDDYSDSEEYCNQQYYCTHVNDKCIRKVDIRAGDISKQLENDLLMLKSKKYQK